MSDQDYYSGKDSGYVFSYNIMRSSFLWRAERSHVTAVVRGGSLLDVGCAFGFFLETLPESVERHGIDLSQYAVAQARALHADRIAFEVCDIEKQEPFGGKKFDMATCFNVLEHFEEPHRVVANIAEALVPEGKFYARFPFRDPIFGRDKYHYYRSLGDWIDILSTYFDVDWCKHYYTLWGKLSDVRAPAALANFLVIMLTKRQGAPASPSRRPPQ